MDIQVCERARIRYKIGNLRRATIMLSEKPGNFPKKWNAALFWYTSKSTQSLHQTSRDTKTTHLHCKLCMFSRSQAAFCSASLPGKHFLWLNPRNSPFEKNIPTWPAQESKTHCSSLKKFNKIQVDEEKSSATSWNRRARGTKVGLRGVENDVCSGTARLMIAEVALLQTNFLSLSLSLLIHSVWLQGFSLMINLLRFKYLLSCAPLCFGRGMWHRQEGARGWSKVLGSECLQVCENACKTGQPLLQGNKRALWSRPHFNPTQSKWAFCHHLKIATQ